MSDEARGGGPVGPPWSVDVLADLHAGALDSEQSAALWRAVNADPGARAVIDALDHVKVELGRLGAAPAEPMPANYAARLDAALAAEASRGPGQRPAAPGVAPVVDITEARRRRNRRMGLGAAVLTAAAAAVALTFAVLPGTGDKTGGNPVAAPDAGAKPLPVESENLSGAIGQVDNQRDYGPLRDQAGLDRCIQANGINPDSVQTLGVRQVTLDDKPGIFALLTTGELGKFRLLVVEPTCGPGNPGTILNRVFPER